MKEIIKSNFKYFESAYEFNQYLRGELFFYIDSLLSIFSSITHDDLPQISGFMQDIFELIYKWMEIFPQYTKSFAAASQNPLLYHIDMDVAISQCGPEFFDILQKCFGLCNRTTKFFNQFAQEYIIEGTFAHKDKINQ